MPETPQQWHARVSAELERSGHRDSDWSQWDVWPFTADGSVKPLEPPVDAEPERRGAGGVDCHTCQVSGTITQDGRAEWVCWFDDDWMLSAADSSSLPFAMFLLPRRHADLATLTASEAARQGELLAAIERAAVKALHVPRMQVARWGDGGEHLHWWLYARPTGMKQLRGTFLSHWDDLLPARPLDQVRADADLVATALVVEVGGTASPLSDPNGGRR